MAKKNKLWFSGEDAQLAARFTKFMTKVLYARRASYIRALMVKVDSLSGQYLAGL